MQDLSPAGAEALASLRLPVPVIHHLPFGIEILASTAGGAITSQLRAALGNGKENERVSYALEGLLLAMACQGIDVSTPQMETALRLAVKSLTYPA